MANSYTEGATVRVSVTFTVGGAATDPTTVTLRVLAPGGSSANVYTYGDSQVTKSATGAFYKDIVASTPGTYTYRWEGTGAAAGVDEDTFIVVESAIV